MEELILSDDIVGQGQAINILGKIYHSKRTPHALLFTGKAGIGRHKLALNYLKLLNSSLSSPKRERIFGKIDNFQRPYVNLIIPLPRVKGETNEDGAYDKLSDSQLSEIREQISLKAKDQYHQISVTGANVIKINSIRDIRKEMSMNVPKDEFHATIISDAHLMPTESQNALLKNLEEPPERNIFILITEYPDKLLETIRSRCWTIELNPIPENDIKNILIKKYEADENAALLISVLADGSVATARSLFEYNIDDLFDAAITVLRYSMGQKFFTALNSIEKVLESYDPKVFFVLVALILKWIRDTDKYKYLGKTDYFVKHSETIKKFVNKFSDVDIFPVITQIEKLVKYLDNNVYLNVITMNIIFELSNLINRNKVNVSYKYTLS